MFFLIQLIGFYPDSGINGAASARTLLALPTSICSLSFQHFCPFYKDTWTLSFYLIYESLFTEEFFPFIMNPKMFHPVPDILFQVFCYY